MGLKHQQYILNYRIHGFNLASIGPGAGRLEAKPADAKSYR